MSASRSLSVALFAASLVACAEKKAAEAPPAATPNELTITAKDFAFAAPDTVPAGLTRIRLMNQGPDLHHVQIIRLDGGKTLQDLGTAMKPNTPMPEWMKDVGGPNPPVPGGESVAWLTLEAGTYEIVCFVDTPDHVPHVVKGMHRTLVVTPSTTPSATEPTATTTIALTDYMFGVDSLKAGKQTIRIDNNAAQSHEVFIAQFLPGKTMDDLGKWAETYKGPPPVVPKGGVSAIPAGSHSFIEVDLAPGSYALLCFVPDAKDGKPHLMHGMVKVLQVS